MALRQLIERQLVEVTIGRIYKLPLATIDRFPPQKSSTNHPGRFSINCHFGAFLDSINCRFYQLSFYQSSWILSNMLTHLSPHWYKCHYIVDTLYRIGVTLSILDITKISNVFSSTFYMLQPHQAYC